MNSQRTKPCREPWKSICSIQEADEKEGKKRVLIQKEKKKKEDSDF